MIIKNQLNGRRANILGSSDISRDTGIMKGEEA